MVGKASIKLEIDLKKCYKCGIIQKFVRKIEVSNFILSQYYICIWMVSTYIKFRCTLKIHLTMASFYTHSQNLKLVGYLNNDYGREMNH